MEILFECCDNLSFLIWPIKPKPSDLNSYPSTVEAYSKFHNKFLRPSSTRGLASTDYHYEDHTFWVEYRHSPNYCYKLTLDIGIVLYLGRGVRNGSPIGKCIISQPRVWHEPFSRAKIALAWLQKQLGELTTTANSIDLSVHVSGWEISPNDILHLVGKFKKKRFHSVVEERGNFFSGIEVGSKNPKARTRSPFFRCYNKSLHLRQSPSSPNPAYLYKRELHENETVWNFEFSFNSRCISDFKISSLEQLEKSISELWKYATTKFIRHKSSPRTSKKFKRAQASDNWSIIQGCHQVSSQTTNLSKPSKPPADIDAIYQLSQIRLLLLRYAQNKRLDARSIDQVLANLESDLKSNSYLNGHSWVDFVNKRLEKNITPAHHELAKNEESVSDGV